MIVNEYNHKSYRVSEIGSEWGIDEIWVDCPDKGFQTQALGTLTPYAGGYAVKVLYPFELAPAGAGSTHGVVHGLDKALDFLISCIEKNYYWKDRGILD